EPFPRGRVDRVARPDLDDLAIAGLYQAAPLGHVQRLSDRVGMPSGAGTGGEPHGVDTDPGRLFSLRDHVEPDVSGEQVNGPVGRRLLGLDLQLISLLEDGGSSGGFLRHGTPLPW